MADERTSPEEIERLLREFRGPAGASDTGEASETDGDRRSLASDSSDADLPDRERSEPDDASGGAATPDEMESLLDRAEGALAAIGEESPLDREATSRFQFQDFARSVPPGARASLSMLQDVELDMRIELGRTRMPLEEVLQLQRGSVVALDKLVGEPVDVYVNGQLVAQGEVLVINDNFSVRVTRLTAGDEIDSKEGMIECKEEES